MKTACKIAIGNFEWKLEALGIGCRIILKYIKEIGWDL
jgi:hypothetical protein